MTPKHRAHAGLVVLVGILVACSPPLAGLPTAVTVTREPGTATLPAPTIAPATPTPDAPAATATLEPTATATLVPFAEYLAGVAVGLGGLFPPDVVSLTSVALADNRIRRQFNELGVAPVMDAAGRVGVETCYYDGQCAVSLTAPNVYEGLRLDPKSPRTNEMLAAYVDPATGQEAGYLVRAVVYEDAVDGVGKGANADAGAKRDYMWGVQNGKMMLVEVEDGQVRVVRPAYAFFPADPNNPPRYDQAARTLYINGQTIVGGVEVEGEPSLEQLYGHLVPPGGIEHGKIYTGRFRPSAMWFDVNGLRFTGEIRTEEVTLEGTDISATVYKIRFVTRDINGRIVALDVVTDEFIGSGGGLRVRTDDMVEIEKGVFSNPVTFYVQDFEFFVNFLKSNYGVDLTRLPAGGSVYTNAQLKDPRYQTKCEVKDGKPTNIFHCSWRLWMQMVKKGEILFDEVHEALTKGGGEERVFTVVGGVHFDATGRLTPAQIEEINKYFDSLQK